MRTKDSNYELYKNLMIDTLVFEGLLKGSMVTNVILFDKVI